MALPSDLINIKSAGVSRVEFDRSVIQTEYMTGISNIRLIAGFSRKGIFNRPILITSASQATSIFGSIDRSLEKKGSYFHRTILQALQSGPILALNLHAYKSIDGQKVSFTKYDEGQGTADDSVMKLNNIFDTTLFFEPSKSLFNKKVVSLYDKDNGTDFYFTNTATEPITLFVRKNKVGEPGMYQYNISLEEWYNASYPEHVEEFLSDKDDDFATTSKIIDYVYTVYAFKGDWRKTMPSKLKALLNVTDKDADGNYVCEIPNDPKFINKMTEVTGVNLIGSWTGVTIPDTQNKLGQNITLSKQINDDVYTTNILCSIPYIKYEVTENISDDDKDKTVYLQELGVGVVPSGKNFSEQNMVMNQILNTLRDSSDDTNLITLADGYTIDENGMLAEDSTAEGEVYGQTNLYRALIDRDYIQWRYLVDSFGLGFEPSCKDVYTKLCFARQSALALVNFPSAKNITENICNTKTLSADYEALAKEISNNTVIGLPNIESGSTFGAYYYPYVNVMDMGEVKAVPPCGLISNLFIAKYEGNTIWKPTAGPNRGVISGVLSPEVGLIKEDRNYIEPMGINSIIYQTNVGTEVYGNKTAKQTPISSLSSINCRETCIYILDTVEAMLRRYVFEINNAQTRLQIWTMVDTFLKSLKSSGGIYDYNVVMDESNNTPEVIDNQFGILDMSVECSKAMDKIHTRLNILKTGAIASGEY